MLGLEALLGAALAAIVGVVVAYLRGKSKGRQEATQRAREADHDRAEEIRRAVDEVERVSGRSDAVERLRELGRLRD